MCISDSGIFVPVYHDAGELEAKADYGRVQEDVEVDFVTKGGEGIFQIAPEADERESCRQVALLVHQETSYRCDYGDETHNCVQPLQADRVDDEARAEARENAHDNSSEDLKALQFGVHMLVPFHFLHGHSIDRDIVPYNAVHSSPQQKGEDGIAERLGNRCDETVCRGAEEAPQKEVGLEVVPEERQGVEAQSKERLQVPV